MDRPPIGILAASFTKFRPEALKLKAVLVYPLHCSKGSSTIMSALEECSEPEYFTVDSIKITPAVGPLNAPIHVDLALNTKYDIRDAHWEIKWVLDSIRRRYVIVLGKTEPTNYSAGKVTLNFEVITFNFPGYQDTSR